MKTKLFSTLSTAALLAAPVPASAARPDIADNVELGRDAKGDVCIANRDWNDQGVSDPFAISMAITCRGSTASRHIGVARRVRLAEAGKFTESLRCGAPSNLEVAGLGMVQSRRCIDQILNLETVETSMRQGNDLLSVSAVPVALGPAEAMLRQLAGHPADTGNKPAVDASALAPAPDVQLASSSANIDTAATLNESLTLIRSGLFPEASRLLNDALSRLPADAPTETRVEVMLLAGLADSNLGYFSSADARFDAAETLMRSNQTLTDVPILDRKRRAYLALDELNQQQYDGAMASLDGLTVAAVSDQPLTTPATLVALNQPPARHSHSVQGLVSAPDTNALSQLVIDAQANWARSIILLAKGHPADARQALSNADFDVALLIGERINQQPILWLEARIERQRARLLVASGDREGALAAIGKAISILRRAEVNGEIGTVLADAEFERGGILAKDPAAHDAAREQFTAATDGLIEAGVQGASIPPAMEDYLSLLVADYNADPSGPAAERLFRATQAMGDPAIARQFVELQTLVSASPALAQKVQDEQDLQREITRLRFEAADAGATDPAKRKALDATRDQLETRLLALEGELQQNQAYGSVNDAPASIADIQKVLKPGEGYFKAIQIRNSLFGLWIDGGGAAIFHTKAPENLVEQVAAKVRESIDGGGAKLNFFNVGAAYALFQLVAGPVAPRLLAAHEVIVDPAGPLLRVPLGVLVTDKASVAAYAASSKAAPYDYSKVDFVARHVSISTALSARSLIVARGAAPSMAPLPFMGFAQHEPTPVTADVPGGMVSIGGNCDVERKAIALLTRELKPISASELDRAGAALGLAHVPSLTGAAFTDTAVMQMDNLNQFQVLHFATHGLTEGQWGCAAAPPGLVTSLGSGRSAAILSFDEIARLKLDANLVVLSACDTAAGVSLGQARAAGQEEAGASLEGLVRAFLAANARAVMSTYWPISNAGQSEDLMVDFYRAARTGTIGEALRTAQTTILSNPASSHPFYWGAFFIVGDSQKPLLTGAAKTALARPAPSFAATLASNIQ